ncbi:DUF3576 domain-containing protein [Nisaea acidiphila]|uniref:DUF3576 domain-containing protein n=1 Tax=Nisaea acidiphila TaxID=1862145 RepID=A0A9J7ARL1_9PROT|nr:DUF3576 domain-containing protein [Nisaea acidiphila]UUX47949.1 DUF3576 domain-containing protein [Nisaea acidiphila]
MGRRLRLVALLGVFALAACEGADIEYEYPQSGPGGRPTYEKDEKIFGDDGFVLFGEDNDDQQQAALGSGIAVNSFLWRASLDTISFMPLASADPFGGVIITDWYSPPDTPSERFKINIFILDRALRSDGVRAKVFKQRLGAEGQWQDMGTQEKLHRDLEDAILTRARQLRIGSTGN